MITRTGTAQSPGRYDSAEWTQATVTNYDVSAQTLFVNCLNPQYVQIRTDATITVRFNSTTAPAMTVLANTAFELYLDFHHMYVTTTGSTVIRVVFTQ